VTTDTDITVCISTFGDVDVWMPLAHRAWRSAERQTLEPADIICAHRDSLEEARNAAAGHVSSGWLCFLDADDELDPNYLAAMRQAVDMAVGDLLLQPATLGILPDGTEDPFPVVIPAKPLIDGNFLVIGTLIRAEQFHRVGGFRDFPCYEDWDLWLRAWLDGAMAVAVPDAIYRVHVSPNSRNNCSRPLQVATYNRIRNQYLAAVRAKSQR
jgi:glycosyltransferase involved in cell wall biosynthesis